jgi:phosphatidylserine decarboxylase
VIEKIYYIDRRSKKKMEEKIYFEAMLRFLYGSFFGKLIGKPIAYLSFFSKFLGWWQRRSFTKKKIEPFILKYGIYADEFEKNSSSFASFDDFFSRRLKKTARPLSEGAVIPADGRYLFYQDISSCNGFVVKNKKFSLEKLLNDSNLAQKYQTGSMAIARLCPSDYHRFHFPTDCIPGSTRLINGMLHSVNPIAVRQNVLLLAENKRMLTELKTNNYGTILFIEIGATSVGSIHQTYTSNQLYKKGEEKGYFSFGGSSIILLFEFGKIKFAKDLLEYSSQHIETLCLFGQPLEKEIYSFI